MSSKNGWLNKISLATLLVVLMSACSSSQETLDPSESANGANQQQGDTASIAGGDDGSETIELEELYSEVTPIAEEVLTVEELLAEPDSPLASRVIYFAFDSAKISDDSIAILEAHGNFIATNGNVNVRLEGHTDERGTREYNIALGDRRAQSVRRVLLFQGASANQVETVSYGEEQPAMTGHTEDAWNKNRRVEIVYQVN